MTLAPVLDALRRHETVAIRFGLAQGDPVLSADDLQGVGVVDLHRKRTRVVYLGLPQRTQRDFKNNRGGWNPISRLGMKVLRRIVLRGLGTPSEILWEGEASDHRNSPDEEWRASATPGPDRAVRSHNDPGWLLDLLSATLSATKEERQSDGLLLHATLPLSEIADLLPPQTLKNRRNEGSRDLTVRIQCRHDYMPVSVAIRWDGDAPAGETHWQIVQCDDFDVDLDTTDLWSRWESLAHSPIS
jgi:hypothetical protein